ncbi:uncharacterized protein F4812DRAFT_83706 [Daldinia caldariorum]|uniref:uncharacterized protein n=1 Tax=Daldinia caldariorum TaxID=326644 RepID=UPI002007AEC0|nr:uncharacterized protein F4812DRAFT_83706 [Daldinia caldariorum]KAI1466564.1 hypothetical protein F4812DRAFT_83706 [Daldinia caldariorum]
MDGIPWAAAATAALCRMPSTWSTATPTPLEEARRFQTTLADSSAVSPICLSSHSCDVIRIDGLFKWGRLACYDHEWGWYLRCLGMVWIDGIVCSFVVMVRIGRGGNY